MTTQQPRESRKIVGSRKTTDDDTARYGRLSEGHKTFVMLWPRSDDYADHFEHVRVDADMMKIAWEEYQRGIDMLISLTASPRDKASPDLCRDAPRNLEGINPNGIAFSYKIARSINFLMAVIEWMEDPEEVRAVAEAYTNISIAQQISLASLCMTDPNWLAGVRRALVPSERVS